MGGLYGEHQQHGSPKYAKVFFIIIIFMFYKESRCVDGEKKRGQDESPRIEVYSISFDIVSSPSSSHTPSVWHSPRNKQDKKTNEESLFFTRSRNLFYS